MKKKYSYYFLKHKFILAVIGMFTYGAINAWVLSASRLDDFKRSGISIANWEPYLWEYSSFIMVFFLVFYIFKTQSWHPLTYGKIRTNLLLHFMHSIVFSLLHVLGMVLIRELTYSIMGSEYDFGYWPNELVYEYRKDSMSYLIILAAIYMYQNIIKQLEGSAQLIPEHSNKAIKSDKVLIKKKGKEFIIDLDQVSTIESGGNYIYIHTNNNVYPMRATMKKMQKKLDTKLFIRVHRSYIVNINFIKEIVSLGSQEYQIKLVNNKLIPLSRNNRNDLLNVFN